MSIKDKVFYIALVGILVAVIATGVCFGLGQCSYIGLASTSVALVGLLYAFYEDKRHEKMAKHKQEQNNNLD